MNNNHHNNDYNNTGHLISARRPHLVIVTQKMRIGRIVDFTIPADHSVKLKESEKRGKCLGLARELKKIMEYESDSDTNYSWKAQYSHQKFGKGSGGLENKRMKRENPNYSIIKTSQHTEKSPGDMRRLAVS